MPELESFAVGEPQDFLIQSISRLPTRGRRSGNVVEAFRDEYSASPPGETIGVAHRLYESRDGKKLIEAIQLAGLDSLDSYEEALSGFDLSRDDDLSTVMEVLDTRIRSGLCDRDAGAVRSAKKRNRKTVYLPELVIQTEKNGGDVYMAKSLTSSKKIKIAWGLDDANAVIKVDDYEQWENLLGWKKLKNLPHGKRQIREQLGHKLSDDLLDEVAPISDDAEDDEAENEDSSSGRATRTEPSKELLNIAVSSSHSKRKKIRAENIAECFEDDDPIEINRFGPSVDMLVLFPKTDDRNMTDHWWVPGSRYGEKDCVAISTCNKGTFEYLNQYEEVWHIDDYIDQALDYRFETNEGVETMRTVDRSRLVLHIVSEEKRDMLMRPDIFQNVPQAVKTEVEENKYSPPDFPHPDDIIYAPITEEDLFWMRPELRGSLEDGVVILEGGAEVRDLKTTTSLSTDFDLYARARLPDWDFDCIEMERVMKASYYFALDSGGVEFLETLGKLHDNGKKPYSQTPETRWS